MRRLFLLLVLPLLVPAVRAQQWEPLHSGFGIAGTAGTDYTVNLTAGDGNHLYAIVRHGTAVRFFYSPDQGTTWQERPSYVAAGGALASAFTVQEGRVMAIRHSNGALLYSDDRGVTWTSAAAGATSAVALARVGQRIVIAQGVTPYRVSTDGGATWSAGPSSGAGLLNAVYSNGRAFVGLNFAGQLVRSSDGTTWTMPTVSGAFIFTHVWSVGTTFYAKGAAGSVYTSTDDGVTWSALPTANAASFSYVFPNASGSAWLLVGAPANGTTLLRTNNRAEATTDVTLNYPKLVGSATTLCTSNFTATADYAIGNAWQCSLTTPGGVGLYRLRLTAGVSNEPGAQVPTVALALSPNPVAGRLSVQVRDVPAGAARLAVYDAHGRQVALLHDGPVAGVLDAALDVSDLAAGVYLVRLTSGGTVLTRPAVVR